MGVNNELKTTRGFCGRRRTASEGRWDEANAAAAAAGLRDGSTLKPRSEWEPPVLIYARLLAFVCPPVSACLLLPDANPTHMLHLLCLIRHFSATSLAWISCFTPSWAVSHGGSIPGGQRSDWFCYSHCGFLSGRIRSDEVKEAAPFSSTDGGKTGKTRRPFLGC